MNHLTEDQIMGMAGAVLSAHEVTPLSHARKCEVAMEHAVDEYGISPRITAVLLAVKLSNLGWANAVSQTKALLAQGW